MGKQGFQFISDYCGSKYTLIATYSSVYCLQCISFEQQV